MFLHDFNLVYQNSVPEQGLPLTLKMVNSSENLFKTSYKHSFAGTGGISTPLNPDIKDNYALRIRLTDFITHLGLNTPINSNEGASLYYILNKDNNNNFYFSYALTPSLYQNNQIISTPINNVQYLTPLYDGSTDIIPATNISTYINWYKEEVEVRDVSTDNLTTVKNFSNQVGVLHPTNTFLSKQQLINFIIHNNFSLTNPAPHINVRIINGGISITQYGTRNFMIHTSILILENTNLTSPLLIDNNPYKIPEIYYLKAMNVGRLCPPDC